MKYKFPKSPQKERSQIIKELDKLISAEVKKKAGGKCARCKQIRKKMGCSHYYSRRYKGSRWDLKNLDWLCWFPCHQMWEHDKQGGYTDYMQEKLGTHEMIHLKIKAYGVNRFPTSDLQILCEEFKKGKFK